MPSAKAFYQKASSTPKLIHKVSRGQRSVEIWKTTCIVTNFGKQSRANCTSLINPCNPGLTGVRNFPYFPRGGPVPDEKPSSMHKDWQPLGFVSQWGGMEVGEGMMFPVAVVDGLVHQHGGWKLRAECDAKRALSWHADPCPVGNAVMTTNACEELLNHYDAIIHTAPPFFKYDEEPEEKLASCYQSALELFENSNPHERIASPLLGAGCRGFDASLALKIAALASKAWLGRESVRSSNRTLCFGLLEESGAKSLSHLIT